MVTVGLVELVTVAVQLTNPPVRVGTSVPKAKLFELNVALTRDPATSAPPELDVKPTVQPRCAVACDVPAKVTAETAVAAVIVSDAGDALVGSVVVCTELVAVLASPSTSDS